MNGWFGVLGLLLFGYFVLEGFDFGLGMLLPLLGRTDTERRLVINAMGPFFLGNEVWLVAVAGFMAAAFPSLDGVLLAGMYPLIVILLVSWIVRDAGIWFRSRRPSAVWRGFWDGAIVAGSLVIALDWGTIAGNLLQGLPVHADGGVQPDPLGLFNIPALLCGVALAAVFAVHGATFVALRLEGPLRQRAQLVQRRALTLAVGLVLVAAATVFPSVHAAFAGAWLSLVAAVLLLVGLGLGGLLAGRRPGLAFVCTALAAGLPVLVLGGAYPLAAVSTLGAGQGLAVARAAADPGSLDVLRWFLVFVVPVVLAYQAFSWWTFGRRRESGQVPAFF